MCIALFSTAHPDYALIVLNNRDEFLTRPTAPAAWWQPPNTHVLGGRDLLRPIQGTWMGITRGGLIAVLTNFREEEMPDPPPETRSRGAVVNAFLTQQQSPGGGQYTSTADFVKHLVEDDDGLKDVGGFSLVCGRIGEPLAVISNRTPSVEGTTWIMRGKGDSSGGGGSETTVGLSNAAFADRSWTKVTRGEELLKAAIESDTRLNHDHGQERGSSQQKEFIKALFTILNTDTLPRRNPNPNPSTTAEAQGAGLETHLKDLRNSIFIPAIEGSSTLYGTQKQTIVLVSHAGHVTFVERTLYDGDGDARPMMTTTEEEGEEREGGRRGRDRYFEFDIHN